MADTSDDEDSDQWTPAEPIFRGRRLTPSADRFSFNTWDDVSWDSALTSSISTTISAQLAAPSLCPSLDSARVARVMCAAGSTWDAFYRHHSRWFFKDRRWLSAEFPELFGASVEVVWEVGCGAGNTLFPAAIHHRLAGRRITFYACDVSEEAVRLVKGHREYGEGQMCVFVFDANSDGDVLPECIAEGTVDVITCIFVLSALDPNRLPALFRTFFKALRPGGYLLIRDYGWGDLAQTRMKPERVVTSDGSLYTRGDGTAVHFFTGSEFESLAASAGLEVVQNYTDRRLIVNRKRKLEMWRCWIQAKLKKPE